MPPIGKRKEHDPEPTAFARKEFDTLRQSLANLTKEDRLTQAHSLLHFLRFAKRHGMLMWMMVLAGRYLPGD